MKRILDISTILKIGNRAVKKAQEESLKNGISNVYSKNGVIYFQRPNGEITTEIPPEYMAILSEEELKILGFYR
jgi:hypothetical protein